MEERQGPGPATATEQEKEWWLATAAARRVHDNGNRDVSHARDIFRVLRHQGRLGATFGEVRDQLLSWRPPPAGWAVELVLARAAYEGEEGTEGMACSPEWRESFEAAEELRWRHAAVPVETFARWVVMQHELERGGPDGIGKQIAEEQERYGLTDELFMKAVGPDAEQISEEEYGRRLFGGVLADEYYGERGWRVQQHIHRLTEERTDEHG
jgi:hypothetical protein